MTPGVRVHFTACKEKVRRTRLFCLMFDELKSISLLPVSRLVRLVFSARFIKLSLTDHFLFPVCLSEQQSDSDGCESGSGWN